MSNPPKVFVYQEPDARDLPLPDYQTEGSSGVDLRAAPPADKPIVIEPGRWSLVPTGLRVALPPGTEAQIRPRSGLALRHGIGVLNSPGTIDEDYRGEIGVILFNFGPEPFRVARGDRIAQMVFQQVSRLTWEPCEELPQSRRGDGGFGHTGNQ